MIFDHDTEDFLAAAFVLTLNSSFLFYQPTVRVSSSIMNVAGKSRARGTCHKLYYDEFTNN